MGGKGRPEYSLAYRMRERAKSGVDGQVLIDYVPHGTQEKEIIDLWPTLRDYIGRLGNEDTQYHTSTVEDKARYAVCCRHGNAAVIQDCKFVIVTANSAGSKVITQNFGKTAEFIVPIYDEAAMIGEADFWIAMVKLQEYQKITGVWMTGDHNQLAKLVVSRGVRLDVFAAQIEYSIFTRLVTSGYTEVFELLLCGRMHAELLWFPNKRTYGGKLKATIVANTRPLADSYRTWYKEYFKQENDESCRLLSLMVDGTCDKVLKTGSKYNLKNAANIVHLVNSMREAKALPMKDIMILAMYSRQKTVISAMFAQMAQRLRLRRGGFPDVDTADNFQASERTMVIRNTVDTDELGFVDDENRMNMACTRARDVFYLVGSRMTMALSKGDDDEAGRLAADKFTVQRRRVTENNGVL